MEIHWHNAEEIGERARESAEKRIRALAAGHTDLIDVFLMAKSTRHHRIGEREINIRCQLRGKEISVSRTREELSLALHDALDSFEHKVRKLRSRRRTRRVDRPAEPPVLGIVEKLFLDEGYGFILTDAGEQVYFHRNAVREGLQFAGLEEGARVGLDFEGGDEGPQATSVVAPPPDAPAP